MHAYVFMWGMSHLTKVLQGSKLQVDGSGASSNRLQIDMHLARAEQQGQNEMVQSDSLRAKLVYGSPIDIIYSAELDYNHIHISRGIVELE